MVERLVCNEEVAGSTPVGSTVKTALSKENAVCGEYEDGDQEQGEVSGNFGECPICSAKLVPLDGGGGAYCPEGCEI